MENSLIFDATSNACASQRYRDHLIALELGHAAMQEQNLAADQRLQMAPDEFAHLRELGNDQRARAAVADLRAAQGEVPYEVVPDREERREGERES